MTTPTAERAGKSARDTGHSAMTVIVPGYGVAAMLPDALDSLIAQDRFDWQAIVVDDGDARVAGRVTPYLADPRISLLRTDNRGLAAARNRAIAVSTTPYVALLDGDDMLEPDYVSSMIAAIEASPRIGFATGDATFFGADRVGERFSAFCPQVLPATLERVLSRAFNVFGLVAMRREAIEGIGGFDASLRSAEDLDAWIRLLEAGWELAYVPRPLARYRRRAGQMSGDTPVMLHSSLTVMDKARARLAGRPEQVVAAAACAAIEQEMAIEQAFQRLAKGDIRAGVADLARLGVGTRSPRWRTALWLMRIAPFLAPSLLRLGRRG